MTKIEEEPMSAESETKTTREGQDCQESKTQTEEDKQWRRNQGCRSLIKGIETCINSPGNYSCQCPKGYKHEGMDEKSCIKDNKWSKAILLIISLDQRRKFNLSRIKVWTARQHADFDLSRVEDISINW